MENMVMNPSFWFSKKVFITGHTGFKGSWLSLWLQQLGAKVIGYALPPSTHPSLFEVVQVAQGMISIIGDIRDGEVLTNAMQQTKPDVVIHLAAQPLVRQSYVDPVLTYSTNVMGTIQLLEAVRKTPSVRSVVNVTSDKCYENKEWVWGYRENEPMGGFDAYSSSKGCSELVTAAYRNSFFNGIRDDEHQVALATARAGNVIGGGDWANDRLIPDIVRAIETEQSVKIRNPNATRPWQHVLDPLNGYLELAEKLYTEGPAFGQAFNFGPAEEDAKPVQWIVEQFIKSWGDGARWQLDGDTHPHEADYLKLDCSKARVMLDWKPRWNLTQSLQAIITWYKIYSAHQSCATMRSLCLQQIKEYSQAMSI
jgi:CDP-glucose 4,6-dehydratase